MEIPGWIWITVKISNNPAQGGWEGPKRIPNMFSCTFRFERSNLSRKKKKRKKGKIKES